jgi:hypothetical protein
MTALTVNNDKTTVDNQKTTVDPKESKLNLIEMLLII